MFMIDCLDTMTTVFLVASAVTVEKVTCVLGGLNIKIFSLHTVIILKNKYK